MIAEPPMRSEAGRIGRLTMTRLARTLLAGAAWQQPDVTLIAFGGLAASYLVSRAIVA